MPKIRYKELSLRAASLELVRRCNEIVADYQRQGFSLTLRQLYYQLVARAVITNDERSYKNLGRLVSDARLAGLLDWSAIVDRTREVRRIGTWDSPRDIIRACATSYREDLWASQDCRVELWVEKEALAGVFEPVADKWQLPLLSCRGYTSQSEMWGSARRIADIVAGGQEVHILHFGDHDPSGLDMTRDIRDRLEMFGGRVTLHRVALNMPQVEEHNPPPNPAKVTDARFEGYAREFGDESWELDALSPPILARLVEDELAELVDRDRWEAAERAQDVYQQVLLDTSQRWTEVVDFLQEG